VDYTYPSGVDDAIFAYDILGNRETVTDSLNDVSRSYISNTANEYSRIDANTITQTITYDPRGNLSQDDGFDSIDGDFFDYTYDAENRLSEVNYDYDGDGNNLTLMARYRYDAMGRRTLDTRRTHSRSRAAKPRRESRGIEYIDATRDVTTRYYYDGQNP